MKLRKLYNIIQQSLPLLITYVLFLFIYKVEIQQLYSIPFLIILSSVMILSIYSTSLSSKKKPNFSQFIKKYGVLFFIILGVISLIINNSIISNNLIVITFLSYFTWGILFTLFTSIKYYKDNNSSFNLKLSISLFRVCVDFLLFILILGFNIHFILKSWVFSTSNILQFTFLVLSWFISTLFSNNFLSYRAHKNLIEIINNYVLDFLILISISYFFIDILLQGDLSLFIFPLTIYIIWSLIISIYNYISIKQNKTDEIQTKLLRATTYVDILENECLINESKYNVNCNQTDISSEFKKILTSQYLPEHNRLFNFLDKNLNLDHFSLNNSLIIKSSDIYNIKVVEDNKLDLFINLHEINDIRRINEYFIVLNKKISYGGIVVGKFEPIRFRYRHFLEVYPKYISHFLYFIDFIWKRIFPKIPILKKIYFFLSKGKKRVISFSEGLGRLYFCGFEVLSLEAIDNFIYFIVKKVKEPSSDLAPSYGPLFKMNRVGKNGKIIKVYKFRTMHPYSEYLQKFTFDLNQLEKGGKIKDDFRITNWGKFLRKFWLDELPMIINFIKGELKLVGVRPLSKHYLSLYPEEVREMRIKFKPGLVPPFYADLPKTLDEIIESEVRYMKAFKKNKIITDISYFFKAWNNIIFKKARSA